MVGDGRCPPLNSFPVQYLGACVGSSSRRHPAWHRRCLLGVAMKPAVDTNKHADDHGSSSSEPSPADHGWARLRKELKRERKRERDEVRRIAGWEQYRTLWDGIEFSRQLINMGDKKVRFAGAVWCEAAPECSAH